MLKPEQGKLLELLIEQEKRLAENSLFEKNVLGHFEAVSGKATKILALLRQKTGQQAHPTLPHCFNLLSYLNILSI